MERLLSRAIVGHRRDPIRRRPRGSIVHRRGGSPVGPSVMQTPDPEVIAALISLDRE
jgi:hypothetical protein